MRSAQGRPLNVGLLAGMADASSRFVWSPSTIPVAPEDFGACLVVVLHYWAVWNMIDREMDKRIAMLREEYRDRICFRSCDVDCAENQPFIHGIANIPALGCFIRGKWFQTVIGLRSLEAFRPVFDKWLAAAAIPAN